jgi:hypothetical protein
MTAILRIRIVQLLQNFHLFQSGFVPKKKTNQHKLSQKRKRRKHQHCLVAPNHLDGNFGIRVLGVEGFHNGGKHSLAKVGDNFEATSKQLPNPQFYKRTEEKEKRKERKERKKEKEERKEE